MKFDRFDILNILAATALFAGALVMAASGGGGGQYARPASAQARAHAAEADPALLQKMASAKTLFDSGQASEAAKALEPLARDYPAAPDVHALLGQAYSALQDYPKAMKEYRTALMMDPEYVDKKSEKFIGKRIKATVKEGMAQAKSGLEGNKDMDARAALKDAYYLERMLAGGCE